MEVSVVIPVFNAAAFVGDAVRSVLEHPEVEEVILVEDGSRDASLPECEALVASDPRVRLFTHPGGANRGASASRNLGMVQCTKEFMAFLDADDRFLPHRFEVERGIFRERPDADGVYGAIDHHVLDAVGGERYADRFGDDLVTMRQRVAPERLFDAFIGLHEGIDDPGHFSLIGMTLRREAWERSGCRFNEALMMHEDSEFIVRLSHALRLHPGALDRAVSSRGVHAGNRITAVTEMARHRYLEKRSLLEWARREKVGTEAVRRLKVISDQFRILSAKGWKDRWRMTLLMMTNPAQWKRLASLQGYIRLMTGGENAISRTLERAAQGWIAMLWKLRGGTPPTFGQG